MVTVICYYCLEWTVLCGFTFLQMCLLWNFRMLFLVKPPLSAKSTRLLHKRSSPPVAIFLAWANGMGTVTVHGEHVTRLCVPHVQIVFDLSMRISTSTVCALPHTPQPTTEGRTLPVCQTWWRMAQNVCGFKVCVEHISPHTALQPLHHYHRLCQELSAYRHIIGMCTCSFKHRLTKWLW
jgi:hypothetical protein